MKSFEAARKLLGELANKGLVKSYALESHTANLSQALDMQSRIEEEIHQAHLDGAKIEDICFGDKTVVVLLRGLNFPGELLSPVWNTKAPGTSWRYEIEAFIHNAKMLHIPHF